MFECDSKIETDTGSHPADLGYQPAIASRLLEEGKFSRAVGVCKQILTGEPDVLSVRLIYGRALYYAGQLEAASDQLYSVLSRDPDNIVALKYLGDIKFAGNDELEAMLHYSRVLEIDPYCRGLCSPIKKQHMERTQTITFKRHEEVTESAGFPQPLKKIYFFTETMGDLYLKQGYPRLAAEVFRVLNERNSTPGVREKLSRALDKAREKETAHVKKTD